MSAYDPDPLRRYVFQVGEALRLELLAELGRLRTQVRDLQADLHALTKDRCLR